MAMAAKAKLLLRELKTVKADLAFAKERCGQLEEENRVIRESSAKGGGPEDDDLVCISTPQLQVYTLLLFIFLVLHTTSSTSYVYEISRNNIFLFVFIHVEWIVGCYRYFKLNCL